MSYGHIDITLTTISSRVDTVIRTIQSLLDQNYSSFSVKLYISKEPFLLDQGIPEIPQSFQELQQQAGGRLKVIYCQNMGPYRKLLPYLRHYWGQSRLVVTADDDTIYPSDWLPHLLEAYKRKRCQIAYRGHRIIPSGDGFAAYRSWMRSKIEENPSALILPTGKDGVLYDTAYFPVEVLNVEKALLLAPTADDLWFRWHLARNGVPVYIINTDYRTAFDENDYESSLYLNYNRGGSNDASIAQLDNYFKENHSFSLALAD